MTFTSAVTTVNRLLRTIQPDIFCSSWIRQHAPGVYRYMQKNVRAEGGGIDWDRFTRALERMFQQRWHGSRRGRPPEGFRDKRIVESILNTYRDKLYTFLSSADAQDRQIRDVISIALVRTAQHGNPAAQRELVQLLRHTINEWIEQYPGIACWEGRDDMVERHIEGCIRRYRYSGSFIGYLFKTLAYAGRGIRPVVAYSLDDHLYDKARRRSDRVAADTETGELVIYGKVHTAKRYQGYMRKEPALITRQGKQGKESGRISGRCWRVGKQKVEYQ